MIGDQQSTGEGGGSSSSRLLILGAGGQLGRELARRAPPAGFIVTALPRAECDIADPDAVARALSASRAEAVINCAAWTRVDAAESAVEAAYRVNSLGPRVLAAHCAAQGVLLTHVSTDFVFAGTATSPMDERTAPGPLSTYGASKLAGEEEIRHGCRRHQIVRTAWLYGQDGPNFVLTILRRARTQKPLRVVADQRGAPTWTGHLASAILRLVELDVVGTIHLTASGDATWHEFAEAILAEAGIERRVEAIRTSDYPTPARRPAYSVLDNRVWRDLGERPLPQWREGLRSYLSELGARGALFASATEAEPDSARN